MATDTVVDRDTPSFRLGYDIVGPVFHRWLIGLDQHVAFLRAANTRFLFCARAGVRIERLYLAYLAARGLPTPDDMAMFWGSRVLACKGVFDRARARAVGLIEREFADAPLRHAVDGLLRHQPALRAAVADDPELDRLRGAAFGAWFAHGGPSAATLHAYLAGCGADFDAYLAELAGDASRIVLIDSGWQGTTQSLLAHAYPERDWLGLYVGRSLLPGHDPEVVDRAIGILFEAERYDPPRPATAIVECRHLVETILEPNGESIGEVVGGRHADQAAAMVESNVLERVDPDLDVLFLAVERYVADHARISLAEAFARYEQAVARLARILIAPTRDEALALVCKTRSADFGRTLCVPVLDAARATGTTEQRVRAALWARGQIALEPCPIERLRLTALLDEDAGAALRYFDPAEAGYATGPAGEPPLLPEERQRSVAIVTRTRDRPLMLRRTAASIAAQTHANLHWIVVNDGGDEAAVRAIIAASAVDPARVTLVSNPVSRGMEAASNLGLRHADAEFVVIHDDDDSWHPRFLEKAAGFLASPGGARYGGVVARTEIVSEEIVDGQIVEHSRRPHFDRFVNIQISDMVRENIFAPIAFLYRASCLTRIGGYDESLPVLGDWLFNLEFLMADDIAILDETLAYYHQRERQAGWSAGPYGNSVCAGVQKHREYAAVVRNAFVRKHVESPLAGAALVGYMLGDRGAPSATGLGANDAAAGLLAEEADRRWVVHHLNGARVARAAPDAVPELFAIDLDWASVNEQLTLLGVVIPVPSDFDDRRYLFEHPDVAQAVSAGGFTSGYAHYIAHGRAERRHRTTCVARPRA